MNPKEERLTAFGQRLKEYLDKADLPQKALTKCVGLTEGPISKIVSGTYSGVIIMNLTVEGKAVLLT